MGKLELEVDEQPPSDDDADTCGLDEIEKTFTNCVLVHEKMIGSDKNYVLQVAGTLESAPNLAFGLSDNMCEVYSLSNSQLAQLTVFSGHKDVISGVKFCRDNSNLLYTGSMDGSIKLWDLRQANRAAIQFIDETGEGKSKELSCMDVSPNGILLTAGTNLFESDAFILFWDIRNHDLLGGYWESHTDDVTQVKFHPTNSNKLISGSVDGLMNVYDLSQACEDNALTDTLNTESSIEKVKWVQSNNKDVVSCITHTADVQFWKLDDAQPYLHLHREDVSKGLKRKTEGYVYVVDIHEGLSKPLLFAGSNYREGEVFRGLEVGDSDALPALGFPQNKQRIRTSWFNVNTNVLVTGGEKGIVNVWDVSILNRK